MNRFRNAWLALAGRLEPQTVERVVIGDASTTDLYAVWVPDKNGDSIRTMGGSIIFRDGEYRYYPTCEQAHKAHPEQAVSTRRAVIIGGQHFVGEFNAVKVQPKPKVAKGRK